MGASSGHPVTRVPMGPTLIRSYYTPLITSGFRPTGASGVVTRSKTRPSHFQKWVKKFNGPRDPYDHLASFKKVVRVEEVSRLTCPQGRLWIDLGSQGLIMVSNLRHGNLL